MIKIGEELERIKKQREYQITEFVNDVKTCKELIERVSGDYEHRILHYFKKYKPENISIVELEEFEKSTARLHEWAKTIKGYVKYWQKKDWHDK